MAYCMQWKVELWVAIYFEAINHSGTIGWHTTIHHSGNNITEWFWANAFQAQNVHQRVLFAFEKHGLSEIGNFS
jgi:hypothetical protein